MDRNGHLSLDYSNPGSVHQHFGDDPDVLHDL